MRGRAHIARARIESTRVSMVGLARSEVHQRRQVLNIRAIIRGAAGERDRNERRHRHADEGNICASACPVEYDHEAASGIVCDGFHRDSPDESQTGINIRVFPVLLQDRREVLTATSTSGNPNAWSSVSPGHFPSNLTALLLPCPLDSMPSD